MPKYVVWETETVWYKHVVEAEFLDQAVDKIENSGAHPTEVGGKAMSDADWDVDREASFRTFDPYDEVTFDG